MRSLHLDLKPIADNYAELRFFEDNPNQYKRRSLPLEQIADLLNIVERDYYTILPENYVTTGRRLYNWLDGSERFLQRLLEPYRREGMVLAIRAAAQLAYLPWEVLHDGQSFLVQKLPGIIPVRWVSSDTSKKLAIESAPENRALQVLFMATSPLGVQPVLDYEAEEAQILTATARQPLALTVEESGCLSELGYLVNDFDGGDFDVFHLTGHATLQDNQPRFITETETGDAYYASATEIAQELQFRLPKLIFLSGCRTGQAGKSGAVPSMAEELLERGATAVLGWGQKVLENDATAAAAALYKELARGKKLTEAIACTYQELIKNKARDWHLLRLYAADSLPGELVTPLRTRGRTPAPSPSVATQFLDVPKGTVKVPTRESFVGRRRQLQQCLKALTQSPDEVGVLIHGMGGLGKSSLAARLCDRLANFQRVVWVGRIDEASLVSRLADKLDIKEWREALLNPDEELKYRLRRLFQQQKAPLGNGDWGDRLPFLLVLDDFEVNLESRNDSYVLQPEAAMVLAALVWAIREVYAADRLIITCRYDFDSPQLQYFYKQPLEALHGADLRKKCSRLAAFADNSGVDKALQLQAKTLADGNPRLLEWLDKILQNSTVDKAVILHRLESEDKQQLREQVLAEALLQQMDNNMEEMLSRGLAFELPVPKEALAAVCDTIADIDKQIHRAVALGLLEVSFDASLRVPRILPLQLPEDGESLYKQAVEVLYRLWWKPTESSTEEQAQEIHRLALLGKKGKIAAKIGSALAIEWKNQSRFREASQLCKTTLEIVADYRVLHQLARSEQELGEVELALNYYQQALELCPAEDEKERAAIIHNIGYIYANTGEIEQAIAFYQQSLKLKKRIGDIQGKAATLHCLAMIYDKTGEIATAIAFYQQSLELEKRSGDIQGKAATLHCLAVIYAKTGEIAKAIAFYQQSLELFERIGDIQGKAATLHQLAGIYANTGEIEQAIAFYQQSLELFERIGDVQGKAMTLGRLGKLLADKQGDFDTAIEYLQQSLAILQRLRSPEAEKVQRILDRVKSNQLL
ncbi:MAG TPA: NB-ARC domain-containing protein [Cyanobacteria bacterium UBA11372]|nr:NB-ARC domain-containing protein [Cyanobacteria bacterium UBA11372]